MGKKLAHSAGAVRLLGLPSLVLAMVTWCSPPAMAGDPSGDLNLQLRLLDTPSAGGSASARTVGVARIEATLDTFVDVKDIRLSVLISDGTPLQKADRPVHPGHLSWQRSQGNDPDDPLVTGREELSLGKRQTAKTTFALPLPKVGLYTVVAKATGMTASGPVSAEAMVLAGFGVPVSNAVEVDGVAEFGAVSAQEARP